MMLSTHQIIAYNIRSGTIGHMHILLWMIDVLVSINIQTGLGIYRLSLQNVYFSVLYGLCIFKDPCP